MWILLRIIYDWVSSSKRKVNLSRNAGRESTCILFKFKQWTSIDHLQFQRCVKFKTQSVPLLCWETNSWVSNRSCLHRLFKWRYHIVGRLNATSFCWRLFPFLLWHFIGHISTRGDCLELWLVFGTRYHCLEQILEVMNKRDLERRIEISFVLTSSLLFLGNHIPWRQYILTGL